MKGGGHGCGKSSHHEPTIIMKDLQVEVIVILLKVIKRNVNLVKVRDVLENLRR